MYPAVTTVQLMAKLVVVGSVALFRTTLTGVLKHYMDKTYFYAFSNMGKIANSYGPQVYDTTTQDS